MCSFGMVLMFVPVLVHVPRPVTGIIETKLTWLCMISSSLLNAVAAERWLSWPGLVALPIAAARECTAWFWFAMLDCRRPSMRFRRSRMSLSPASSLIPGSR